MIRILLPFALLVAILPPDWIVQGSNLPISFDFPSRTSQGPFLEQPILKKESKRSQPVVEEVVEVEEEEEEAASEVVWTSECSPRVAGVRRGQDARLQCQVIAPSGSVLTWFKDDVLLRREGASAEVESTSQELVEEMTNLVGLTETSSSLLQISSVVYLDCIGDQHQATYKLEVRTPQSNRKYSRLFAVVIVGDGSVSLEEGRTCSIRAQVNAIPRIYQHSPAAMGHVGDFVTLPCRSQGLNVTREWFLNGHRISSQSTGYQILSNGDLVAELMHKGRKRFMCKATSTRYSALRDAAITVVAAV